jgi:hypothetical protein
MGRVTHRVYRELSENNVGENAIGVGHPSVVAKGRIAKGR